MGSQEVLLQEVKELLSTVAKAARAQGLLTAVAGAEDFQQLAEAVAAAQEAQLPERRQALTKAVAAYRRGLVLPFLSPLALKEEQRQQLLVTLVAEALLGGYRSDTVRRQHWLPRTYTLPWGHSNRARNKVFIPVLTYLPKKKSRHGMVLSTRETTDGAWIHVAQTAAEAFYKPPLEQLFAILEMAYGGVLKGGAEPFTQGGDGLKVALLLQSVLLRMAEEDGSFKRYDLDSFLKALEVFRPLKSLQWVESPKPLLLPTKRPRALRLTTGELTLTLACSPTTAMVFSTKPLPEATLDRLVERHRRALWGELGLRRSAYGLKLEEAEEELHPPATPQRALAEEVASTL